MTTSLTDAQRKALAPSLTDAERDALSIWDDGSYTCDCPENCPSLPCLNGREDLLTTVERILTTHDAGAQASSDYWYRRLVQTQGERAHLRQEVADLSARLEEVEKENTYYSVAEAAALLGVTRQRVLQRINDQTLPAVRIGRVYGVPARAIRQETDDD